MDVFLAFYRLFLPSKAEIIVGLLLWLLFDFRHSLSSFCEAVFLEKALYFCCKLFFICFSFLLLYLIVGHLANTHVGLHFNDSILP